MGRLDHRGSYLESMPPFNENDRDFVGLIVRNQAKLRAFIISLMPGGSQGGGCFAGDQYCSLVEDEVIRAGN